MSHSAQLLSALEDHGYDHATAETIVNMADTKSINEAHDLLSSMLGDSNKHLKIYVANRRNLEVRRQNQRLPSSIKVEAMKPKTKSNKPSRQISSTEKIDSLKDLEAAMKKLSVDSENRKQCDCMGSVHGLLDTAPNCLNCGRIICKKEGLGPCLYCKEPLLPNDELKKIIDILTEQKNTIIATMSKKALVAAGIDPSAKQGIDMLFKSKDEAEQNLERLLDYQANDTQRTRIIDRVGDVDVPSSGGNKWATPQEQADLLRAQQRTLRRREIERKARTQGTRKVLSIDVRGNKVYQSIEDAPLNDEYLELIAAEEDEEEQQRQQTPDHARHPSASDGASKQDETAVEATASPYYDAKKFSQYKVPKLAKARALSNTIEPEKQALHIRRDSNEDLQY